MHSGEHGICPSAAGDTPDSVIVGFIGRDGHVAPIPTPIPLTPELRGTLGPKPERNFRLAGSCIAGRCDKWTGTQCGLIGAMQVAFADAPPSPVVQCGIRAGCVWFRDAGLAACRVCTMVTYNPA